MCSSHRKAMHHLRQFVPDRQPDSELALSILAQVDRNPEIYQMELSRRLNRDPVAINSAVRNLHASGFIRKINDKSDNRVKRLVLTKKGSALTGSMKSGENKILLQLISKWGRNRVNLFLRNLEDLNEFLKRQSNNI